MRKVRGLVGLVLAFTMLPAMSAAEAQCLFETSEVEDEFVETINAYRETFERSTLGLDQVLQATASAYMEIESREGDGEIAKLRAQTRDQVLSDTVTVGALIMKGKSLDAIWKRMTRNQYPRSVLRRPFFEHIGLAVGEANDRVYVIVVLGGELVTPLSC